MCCLLCCIGCGPINKNCGIGNCAVCLAKYHWSFRVVAAVVAVAVYHFNMRSIRLNRIEWHAFCGGRRTVNGCFWDNNLGVVNIIMCVAFVRTKWKWSNSFGEFEPTNWVRQRTFVQCVPNMRGDKILLLFQSATQIKCVLGERQQFLRFFFHYDYSHVSLCCQPVTIKFPCAFFVRKYVSANVCIWMHHNRNQNKTIQKQLWVDHESAISRHMVYECICLCLCAAYWRRQRFRWYVCLLTHFMTDLMPATIRHLAHTDIAAGDPYFVANTRFMCARSRCVSHCPTAHNIHTNVIAGLAIWSMWDFFCILQFLYMQKVD